jgi:PAS domain S-box-containing protein
MNGVVDKSELLNLALENLPNVVVTDRDMRIIYMNKSYTDMLGVTQKIAIGSNVADIIPGTRLPLVMQNQKDEHGQIMHLLDHQTNKIKTVVCNRTVIRKAGKAIGTVGMTIIEDFKDVIDLYEEIQLIRQENQQFKTKIDILENQLNPLENLIGSSESFLPVKKMITDYADSNLSILLTGETGTGKEPVARAIHRMSSRAINNYVKINCAAIPESLQESELFGYAGESFTGAGKRDKIGKYELADKGTLLLDEIGEMSLGLQAKLLRVLQEGEFDPVGGIKTKKANVRLICSTNRDLKKMIREGKFREDLYYRINVVEINLPPLRERVSDIYPLCKHFIQKINTETGKHIFDIEKSIIHSFELYPWPGNIRELEHVLARAAVISKGDVLTSEHFYFFWERTEKSALSAAKTGTDLKEMRAIAEKQVIIEALAECGGNKTKTAKFLNIDRTGLYNKMHTYGILL